MSFTGRARDWLGRRRREDEGQREREAEWQRELEVYGGPLGREDTVWGHGPGVHAEDRAAWHWLGEDPPPELVRWSQDTMAAGRQMPHGARLYDLDAGLGVQEWEELGDSARAQRAKEFHADVLRVFRRATAEDEWIYAIDEPEAGDYYCYRFWPHRATETTRWYVSPIPDGDDEYFVSQDFSWGLLGLFGGFPRCEWQVCVFGQQLLGAVDAEPPQAFSTVLEGDAFSQRDPEEDALETTTALLMLKLGLNCQLARDNGLWSRDLERRYRRLDEEPALEDVAGLIARVELALSEAGVEYEPAMSHLDDDRQN